jgi:ABC-type transport system involved in cytochrome bd biosynthesis fused ATPase/permease subunit
LESVEIALRARGLKAKLTPLVEIIVAVGTSMVLWFGARMVMRGSLSAGSLIVFILYLGKMYKPMQELSKTTDAFSKASVGYERIREILETQREVADLPGARPAPPFRGKIEFDNVNFHYEPGTPVLTNVTLRIEAGQTAALAGPTGAGKTSIVSLIPRFYDLSPEWCESTGGTYASSRSGPCGSRSVSYCRKRCFSTAPSGTTSRTENRMRAAPKSTAPPNLPTRRNSSIRCLRDTTR